MNRLNALVAVALGLLLMIAAPSAQADTNSAQPVDQVTSTEPGVYTNADTRTSLQAAAPLLVNAQGYFKAGSRYYILRGVPDNVWATSADRARWIKAGVDYHIRGAGPITVFTTNWTALPYCDFFMPNGVREVSVFNFKPAPEDDNAIGSGADHFGETLWGANAFCGIICEDGRCTTALVAAAGPASPAQPACPTSAKEIATPRLNAEPSARDYVKGRTTYVGAGANPYRLDFLNDHPTRLIVVQVDLRKPGTLIPDWRTYRIHPGTTQSVRFQPLPNVPTYRAYFE